MCADAAAAFSNFGLVFAFLSHRGSRKLQRQSQRHRHYYSPAVVSCGATGSGGPECAEQPDGGLLEGGMGSRSGDWPSVYLHSARALRPGVTLRWIHFFWRGGRVERRQVAGLLRNSPKCRRAHVMAKSTHNFLVSVLVLVLCSELVPCPATGERGRLRRSFLIII